MNAEIKEEFVLQPDEILDSKEPIDFSLLTWILIGTYSFRISTLEKKTFELLKGRLSN